MNALARLGAYVTLRNPVGLYMDHIDLSGWEAPDGKGVTDCVRIVRGMPQMIERLVVEVPRERGFTVGDILIGGVPINYGGQIAECITVKLVGIANLQEKPIVNRPISCDGRCCIDPNYPGALKRSVRIDLDLPSGTQAAYVHQGAAETSISEGGTETAALAEGGEALRTATAQKHPRLSIHGVRSRSYFE